MTTYHRNSHCSYCGQPFEVDQGWPRLCKQCHNVSYLNPIPVAVVLIPVGDGLLLVRRGIQPGKGELALPGGYINHDETWQQAAAREVYEEIGLQLEPQQIEPVWVASAANSNLLVFGMAPAQHQDTLAGLAPGEETEEIVVVDRAVPSVFSLHTTMIERFFAR